MIICLSCKKLCLVQRLAVATFVDDEDRAIRYNASCRLWRCPGCESETLEKIGAFELQKKGMEDGEIVLEEGEL